MTSEPRQQLIEAAALFYQKNWMVGTAGNLSARLNDNSFWITASGKNKGELTEKDFIRIALDGTILEQPTNDIKPSAETSIHQAIYTCFPDTKACYHVHSIEANIISRFTEKNTLKLPSIEMLKGLGIWEENPHIEMPLFDNHFHVPDIAKEITKTFSSNPPKVPLLLIRNHGITVWANSPTSARNYIEIIEYIFRYMILARQLNLT
ncbi:MAG TPA: methylthioribulose 1-phosphate dehydratase [Halomicronema sp.]